MSSIIDWLAEAPLFDGLPQEELEALASIAMVEEKGRGEPIFAEGDEAAGLFIVIDGRVKIFKLSAEGKEQILHIFGAGEPFAEVAVFSGTTYPAHAESLSRSRLLFLPKERFVELIRGNPSLAMNMLASVSMRLKQFAAMIEALSLQEVPGRLANHFLLLSEQQARDDFVELGITRGQLASLLGTIPETLSRILAKMIKQGFIEADGSRISLLDRDGLEDLAAGEKRL